MLLLEWLRKQCNHPDRNTHCSVEGVKVAQPLDVLLEESRSAAPEAPGPDGSACCDWNRCETQCNHPGLSAHSCGQTTPKTFCWLTRAATNPP